MRLFAVAAVLLASHVAHAECGVPTWFGTASGMVPTRGVLYVYEGDRLLGEPGPAPMLRWTGVGHASITFVSNTVARIDYLGAPGSTLDVISPWYEEDAAHYTLSAAWQAPAAPPRVLQYWHHIYEWTCSSADSLFVQTDQDTAAFRVRWTYRGVAREWIEPARTDGGKAALEVGKLNCAETFIDPAELRAGGHLALTAIRNDGSEVAVIGIPETLSTGRMPVDETGLDHALDLRSYAPAAPRAPAVKPVPASFGPLLGLFVLALAGIGGVIAWPTRVRVPAQGM